MKAFIGFVVKEVRHILRDWETLLILIGMPVAQVLLFGYAVRSDVSGIRVAFVEPAPDAATASVRARFQAAGGTYVIQGSVTNIAQLDRLFENGRVNQAIVFPTGFGDRLYSAGAVPIQIVTDGSDPNTAGIMQADALAILSRWGEDQFSRGAVTALPGINVTTRMRFNPTLESVNLFVPGLIAYVLIIVSALMTAITIVREKEMGTMEMLLVSPLRPSQVVIGKVAPYILLAFLDVLLVLGVAKLVFQVPLRGSVSLMLAESMLYILSALAVGVLISTIASSQRVAMLAVLGGLMLPTLLLSGFIFPIAALPEVLQLLANVVPARWFVVIARGIMLKGLGIADLWRETAVLAGFTIVLLAVGIRRLSVRLS